MNILKKFKKIFIPVLCAALILPVFAGLIKNGVFAEETGGDFSSGKLVIITETADAIPEGGTITSECDGVYLVDYENPESARVAYETLAEADILCSPETVFSIASGAELSGNVPKETEGALEVLSVTEPLLPDYSGENVIALIDTGAGSAGIIDSYSMLSDDGMDRQGHGSKMAEAITSVDPEARIVSIKAIGDNGKGSISSVYAAIYLAASMHVKVINLSIVAKSVADNEVIISAVNHALQNNIVVVGAAGNSGKEASNYIPGAIGGAIIAGACDENGRILSSSNYGNTVDYNVYADSTSTAAAKLSGFINKNCKNDASLNATIAQALGRGLIFTTDQEALEDYELPGDDWVEVDPEKLTEEQIERFTGDSETNVTGFRYSNDTGLYQIAVTDTVVPDDGSFIPAAWSYASVTSYNLIYDPNNIPWSPRDGNWETGGTFSATSDGRLIESGIRSGGSYLVGFYATYTPGTFEQEALSSSAENLRNEVRYMLLFKNGQTTLMAGAPMMAHASDFTLPVTGVGTALYGRMTRLYKMSAKIYATGRSMMSSPVRFKLNDPRFNANGDYLTDASGIWYEEGEYLGNNTPIIGTISNNVYSMQIGMSLQRYKVFYQLQDDESTRVEIPGGGLVGTTFNFSKAEAEADRIFAGKKYDGWDYSELGVETRFPDNSPVIPTMASSFGSNPDGTGYVAIVIKGKEKINTGSAGLKVISEASGNPIVGMGISLMTESGITVRDDLVTDENGYVSVADLPWGDPEDSPEGYDGNYYFTARNTPEGYVTMRDATFTIDKDDLLTRVENTRVLMIKRGNLSIENSIESLNLPQEIFAYEMKGTDVSGKNRSYGTMGMDGSIITFAAGEYTLVPKNIYARDLIQIQGNKVRMEDGLIKLDLKDGADEGIKLLWKVNTDLLKKRLRSTDYRENSFRQ